MYYLFYVYLQAMRAGIVAEDEKKRQEELKTSEESEAARQRLERNRKDFELQQKLTESLSSEN